MPDPDEDRVVRTAVDRGHRWRRIDGRPHIRRPTAHGGAVAEMEGVDLTTVCPRPPPRGRHRRGSRCSVTIARPARRCRRGSATTAAWSPMPDWPRRRAASPSLLTARTEGCSRAQRQEQGGTSIGHPDALRPHTAGVRPLLAGMHHRPCPRTRDTSTMTGPIVPQRSAANSPAERPRDLCVNPGCRPLGGRWVSRGDPRSRADSLA